MRWGNSFSLTAAGAGNYTDRSGLGPTTGSSIVLTPTASGCYTVASTNPAVSSISKCLTIGTTSTLTITPHKTSVCAGNVITVSRRCINLQQRYHAHPRSRHRCFSVNPTSSTCYAITGNNSGLYQHSAILRNSCTRPNRNGWCQFNPVCPAPGYFASRWIRLISCGSVPASTGVVSSSLLPR